MISNKPQIAISLRIVKAENYDELIDHPVEMGTFELATFFACGVQ